MPNSNNVDRSYNDAATAQLGERVTNLGRRQTDLETEMRAGFKQVESSMATIANEMRSSITTLSSSLAERSRTQWPVIWTAAGVSFTILAALSAFVYGTLSKDQTRLDAAILKNAEVTQTSISKLADTTAQSLVAMTERMVTRQEMEYRQARGAEDRTRMEAAVKEVRDAQVPRAELDRVFLNYDQRFIDQQRQLDDQKQQSGAVYGTRDVIMDLRQRVDRVERDRPSPSP
ncbi:hypothetical protein RMR10_011840 [Agrobacterium rosae]|uniref:hypothetical protein n=1 Tax=Agrobacterium rosae TaxID=1972867 RepID=UPI002A0E7826|nr:hypothetical protein [Agrobacterium rosae]MDX8313319.1 hypothetical protein [Agrobacterium rosae]